MFFLTADYWEIKGTKNKGNGVFTKKKIKSGTIIGDYLGKVIKTAEYDLENDKNGLYLMYLTNQASIYPDLKNPDLHIINHACQPNSWIYTYRGHTLFFALRSIAPGEELTISYLLSPLDELCHPCTHICICESKSCTGSMHLSKDKYAIWQQFQNTQKKKTRTAKFIFGKKLKQLPSYPKTIPHHPIYAAIYSI